MSRNSKFVKFAAMAFMQIALVSAPAIEASAADTDHELKRIILPRANGPVALYYFAYDRATGKVWVPASNTGSVDVIDEKTDAVSQITGFPTGEIERRGKKITVGPTAASIGNGVVYIGNRGNATLCVIDAKTFTRGECVPASPDRGVTPDGVLYVAASQAATLIIAEVGDDGKFHLKATVPTVKGARGVVAGKGETLYLIDPSEGRILKLIRK